MKMKLQRLGMIRNTKGIGVLVILAIIMLSSLFFSKHESSVANPSAISLVANPSAISLVDNLSDISINYKSDFISSLAVDGYNSVKEGNNKCKLNIPTSKDPMFEFVKQCTRLLNNITSKHSVKWVGWGKSTLALLRTGAVFITTTEDPKLKSVHEVKQMEPVFEVYLIANGIDKIRNVWKDLAVLTHRFQPSLSCNINDEDKISKSCSVITPADGRPFKFLVNGPGIYNAAKKELWMSNEWLYVKYVLPLDRVMPTSFASYYGLPIPVPNDPVFIFSHAVPMKNTPAAADISYEFGQGCEDLMFPTSHIAAAKETGLEMLLQSIETCGKNLYENKFASFYQFCNEKTTREHFETLNDILKATPPNNPMFVESFPHVTVVHRGTGNYKLDYPNGIKNNNSWSQLGQDKIIDQLLNGKRDGFFIEMGGLDGEHLSNTLFFEKERGWDGLLVEANPYTFEIMLGRDRKCYMVNACVSSSNVTELTFKLAGGITSSNELMTEEHRKRQNREFGSWDGSKLWAHEGENVKVHCKSLLNILDKIGNRRIDFFSLDVDGSEMFILNSIEWDKIDIDIIMIEMAYRQNELRTFITNLGFKRVLKLPADEVFRKVKTTPLSNVNPLRHQG